MSKSHKKINKTPRRKRMRRPSRLQAAKHWIPTYNGKHLIKGYQKWFGVDVVCAIQELKLLGVKLDEQYVQQILDHREKMLLAKRKKIAEKQQREQELEDLFADSDDYFAYIAGYTNWGFPYGITWEEMEELEEKNPLLLLNDHDQSS